MNIDTFQPTIINNDSKSKNIRQPWIWKDAFHSFSDLQNNITHISQNINSIIQSFFLSLSDDLKHQILISFFSKLNQKINEVNPNKIRNSTNILPFSESISIPFQLSSNSLQIFNTIINQPLSYSNILRSFNLNNLLTISSPMWILLDTLLDTSIHSNINPNLSIRQNRNRTVHTNQFVKKNKNKNKNSYRIPTLFQSAGSSISTPMYNINKNHNLSIFHQILTQFQNQAGNIYQFMNEINNVTNQYSILFKNQTPSVDFYQSDDLYSLFQFENISQTNLMNTLENIYIDLTIIRHFILDKFARLPFDKLFPIFSTYITHVTYSIPLLCIHIYKYQLINYLPIDIQNKIKIQQMNQQMTTNYPSLYSYMKQTSQNGGNRKKREKRLK